MLSDDGGETWTERRPPAAVIDLAVDPGDPRRIVASTEAGLVVSENDGRSWRPLGDAIGLVSWPEAKRLDLIDANGEVQLSQNGGRAWDAVGQIGGQPAAMAAAGQRNLYAALAHGQVVESTDGGESWQPRS